MDDLRDEVAKFYDAATTFTGDALFYEEHINRDDPTILELGCGTGRVTIPLAGKCKFITGVDISESMLSICRDKIESEKIPNDRVRLKLADITKLELNRKFGFIIAPYRVFQNLETDEQVAGFFSVVKRHLSSNGSCIINVFNPNTSR